MPDLPPGYYFIRELGTYDQLPSDIQAQLLDLPGYSLPPSAYVKAEGAMIKHLEKADPLMEEAKALGDNTVKLGEAFERVRKGLGQVDADDYKDKDGNPIPKLQSTWVDYQKRWTTLLWGSRDVATKTEAYVKDFLEVIVPGVEDIKTKDDLEDARLDLDLFVKRKDPKQLNSEGNVNLANKYSQDLTVLKLDLETFQANFDRLFANREVDLDIAITQKQAEKKRLDQRTTLSRVYDRDTNSSRHMLNPIFKFHIIGAIAASAISELRVQRHTAQTRLEGLQAPLKDLQGLRAIFKNQKTDILDICGRLDRFADIWRLVRHDSDAEFIQSGLSAAVGDQGSKKVLKKRIDLMKASYTTLRDALNLYATTITLSNAKK